MKVVVDDLRQPFKNTRPPNLITVTEKLRKTQTDIEWVSNVQVLGRYLISCGDNFVRTIHTLILFNTSAMTERLQ